MTTPNSSLHFYGQSLSQPQVWQGAAQSLRFDLPGIKAKLLNLTRPCYVVNMQNQLGVTNEGQLVPSGTSGQPVMATAMPIALSQLGDPTFLSFYGLKFAYMGGSMANAISSTALVIALGQAGMLCSFGSAGMVPARIEEAIKEVQQALPNGPYAFNLIHSPNEEALERNAIQLYLRYNVPIVEASAYLDLTPHIVHYRAAGLSVNQQNQIVIKNKVIAKLSRREVAAKFMQPAPVKILRQLVEQGLISELQANLAQQIPVADDITAEADSGGHTDNRPLVSLLPSIIALRDEIQAKYNYAQPLRVGAGGGVSTPASTLATFMMGAAYVVTGSVNQACVESGACVHARKLLAEANMADVTMAPAADMFEMGVKLQVLKRGTFFPMRAQKLYELYKTYDSLEAIPSDEKEKLEKQIFRRSLNDIWDGCVSFFQERDPDQISRALDNPKRKMALVFRWYLGLSSRWAVVGEKGREMDYQIWCGPAMGAFNDWVHGTYLESPEARHAPEVAQHLLIGAAFLYRLQHLKMQGLQLAPEYGQYQPQPLR